MSKEKAREFLTRLKALEAEMGVELLIGGYDWTMSVFVDGEEHDVHDNDTYELTDDYRERNNLPPIETPLPTDGKPFVLSSIITPIAPVATPFLSALSGTTTASCYDFSNERENYTEE